MEQMTAKEILNLIDWLREQGFDNDKVVECIEYTEGKRKPEREKGGGTQAARFIKIIADVNK